MKYDELVNGLRYCANATVVDCKTCEWKAGCASEKLLTDAAAAIEELQDEIKEAEHE